MCAQFVSKCLEILDSGEENLNEKTKKQKLFEQSDGLRDNLKHFGFDVGDASHKNRITKKLKN